MEELSGFPHEKWWLISGSMNLSVVIVDYNPKVGL